MSDETRGTMTTQSGQIVTVKRDFFGVPGLGGIPQGDDYYYENGSKVYVNNAAGANAPQRPTYWNDNR